MTDVPPPGDDPSEPDHDPAAPDAGLVQPEPALTKDQARELAEAERAEREAQAQREALELARADAERLLAGPGLVTPDPPIAPADLEATWGDLARTRVDDLRRELAAHRVGLAISGGGSLGSFEAGALRFLYDHLAIEPVAICGNSAGALNAAKLAEGDHPDRRPIDEVERLWRSLRINSDMWEPEAWLVRLQASASWAAALREQVSDSDSAASAVRVAVRVVGSLVRRPPETDGTIDAIKEAIRAQSLLSLAPVAALVERELDPDRVRASGIALRMGTVSLEAGELRYVTESGQLHDRHDQPIDQPPVPLVSGVLASASIPMAFPPVEMNDEHYVDGGAREILPLELLVTKMGAEKVIAISASSASIQRAPSFADRNLLDILRRVSAEIGPNETLRKELNPPGGWHPDVRLVVPQFDVHDSMTIDPALIAISMDHGYLRAADLLLGLGDEAAELTERITRLRIDLRHLAGPVPTIFDTTLGQDRRARLGISDGGSGDRTDEELTELGDADHHDGLDDDSGRSRVRAARDGAATRVAKFKKVIGRDRETDADPHADDEGDGAVAVSVTVTDGRGHVVGEVVEVVHPDEDLEVDVIDVDPGSGEHADESDRAEDDPADDDHRDEAIAAVTAELEALVRRRAELGAPLPQSLVAWRRELSGDREPPGLVRA
jgi:predicted acylesterase/phospholipase RssA